MSNRTPIVSGTQKHKTTRWLRRPIWLWLGVVIPICIVGFITLLWLNPGTSSTVDCPEKTIYVARGNQKFKVLVSSDPARLKKLQSRWEQLADRYYSYVSEHLSVAGDPGNERRIANYIHRYQPSRIKAIVDHCFNDSDRNGKIVAARWMSLFNDDRGFNWIVQELEDPNCENSAAMLAVVADWFRNQERRNLKVKHLPGNSGTRAAFKELLCLVSADPDFVTDGGIKVNFQTLVDATGGLVEKDAKMVLRELLEESYGQYQAERMADCDRLLTEYGRRFSDQWILNQCAKQAELQLATNGCISESVEARLHRLCRNPSLDVHEDAISILVNLIQQSPNAVEMATEATEEGVVFPETFMLWFQARVDELAETGTTRKTKSIRFRKIPPRTLAAAFSNTNNHQVIDSLYSCLPDQNQTESCQGGFEDTPLHEYVFAIERVTGNPLDRDLLAMLHCVDLPIIQCEQCCRLNRQTTEKLLELFQEHELASGITASDYLETLRQQVVKEGRPSSECFGRLIGNRYKFSCYEKICGIFSLLEREGSICGKQRLLDDFWTLVDLTHGKFEPTAVQFWTRRHSGETWCEFIWNNKAFSFQACPHGSGLIAPLNAILRSEGVDDCFVIVKGYPTITFLEDNCENALFGPIELFEKLETRFGLCIDVR